VGVPENPCEPECCAGRECGPDGCGGSCGDCGAGEACTGDGTCACEPDCGTMVCGLDPVCQQSCGACGLGTVCEQGACVPGGEISCVAYFVCADGCDAAEPDCVTDCRTAVADAEGDLTERVAACFETSCGTCEDLDCLRTCGVAQCGQDYVDCFSGDATCYDVYQCVYECLRSTPYGTPEGDACRANCLATGTVDDQTRYLALETCIREEGHCDPATMSIPEYDICEQRANRVNCVAQSSDCPSD